MDKILTLSVAAYNVEKYLRTTLDSVLIGDLLDLIEVYVIDDGGTDLSLEIAKEYEKKYPGIFFAIHKLDEGYGSTVNYAIEHAHGKYFKILDGDDYYDKTELYNFVKELLSVDVDMIISRFKRVNESTGNMELVDEGKHLPFGISSFDECDADQWFTMHAITYRTELLQNNHVRLTLNCFYSDSEYNLLPIKYVNLIYRSNSTVYCYRLGLEEQSVSLIGIEKHHNDQFNILKRLYNDYGYSEDLSETKNCYIRNYLIRWSKSYIFNLLIIECNIEHRREILEFINYLRNKHKDIYRDLLRHSILAILLTCTVGNSMMYWILHKMMLRKIGKRSK